jgi:GxxExxY protein
MTTELGVSRGTKNNNFWHEDLSHKIIGILIESHKELGPYAREKQVADLIAEKLKAYNLKFEREVQIGDSGNVVDFIIEEKIILELKTVPFLISEHFDQVKRYLYQTGIHLGLLVNFRDKRLHPKRVLNINDLRTSAELL